MFKEEIILSRKLTEFEKNVYDFIKEHDVSKALDSLKPSENLQVLGPQRKRLS